MSRFLWHGQSIRSENEATPGAAVARLPVIAFPWLVRGEVQLRSDCDGGMQLDGRCERGGQAARRTGEPGFQVYTAPGQAGHERIDCAEDARLLSE